MSCTSASTSEPLPGAGQRPSPDAVLSPIRNTVRALIVQRNHVLLLRKELADGTVCHTLPGGAQEVAAGRLRCVRDGTELGEVDMATAPTASYTLALFQPVSAMTSFSSGLRSSTRSMWSVPHRRDCRRASDKSMPESTASVCSRTQLSIRMDST